MLCSLLFGVIDLLAVVLRGLDKEIEAYLVDVLEPICDEAWQGNALHHFILVHLYRLDCLQALNLGQQDVGIQIIVGKHELLQFCEFFELVEVLVEDNQVETDVD